MAALDEMQGLSHAEEGLRLLEMLIPRWYLLDYTALCPGTCQECGKHAIPRFEAQKKSNASVKLILCFQCFWRVIGRPFEIEAHPVYELKTPKVDLEALLQ